MFQLNRRTFLKLTAAAGAAVGLVRYAEPLQKIMAEHHDWVEDRGDFYIIRVPARQMFAREVLSKPCIFLLGEMAMVADVTVNGFVNLQAPRGGTWTGGMINASNVSVGRKRPALEVQDTIGLSLLGTHILGRADTDVATVLISPRAGELGREVEGALKYALK